MRAELQPALLSSSLVAPGNDASPCRCADSAGLFLGAQNTSTLPENSCRRSSRTSLPTPTQEPQGACPDTNAPLPHLRPPQAWRGVDDCCSARIFLVRPCGRAGWMVWGERRERVCVWWATEWRAGTEQGCGGRDRGVSSALKSRSVSVSGGG